MYYLLQYTIGAPHELISTCLLRKQDGFSHAMKLLDKRYGNVQLIIAAKLNELLDYKVIKPHDISSLTRFSNLLLACQTLHEGNLSELDHARVIKRLMMKLPYKLQNGFRDLVFKVEERTPGDTVKFHHFVEFVEREVAKASHVIFGIEIAELDQNPKQFEPRKPEKNRVNSMKPDFDVRPDLSRAATAQSCLFCSKGHDWTNCESLKQATDSDILIFFKVNKLCFCCGSSSHGSKSCVATNCCQLCSRRHLSILHNVSEKGLWKSKQFNDNGQNSKFNNSSDPQGANNVQSGAISGGDFSHTEPQGNFSRSG